MSNYSDRFRYLSIEQQKLLMRRLREKQIEAPFALGGLTEVSASRESSGEVSDQELYVSAPKKSKMHFSLFFFSADGTCYQDQKYKLLLESAKFADRNEFTAVWTPERHFQAFGGIYPNPSVLSAALAMITEKLQIRAGSVVLPLHSPVRVAEEWAVVDNLSNGRVAISFATGWHEHDFVITPKSYADRRELMFRYIPIVRKLWAGETVLLPGVNGKETPIKTLPRPLQPELPVWVTASASPTWRRAGEIGANILTSLELLSLNELAQNIQTYRQALAQHGYNPRSGTVSLMLHTFIGNNLEETRKKVQKPLRHYLMNYIQQFRPLMDEESIGKQFSNTESLLDFACEHYFHQNALLGTPQKCIAMIEALCAIGVDEVACLVDFGLDFDNVIESLHYLNDIRETYNN